LLTTTAEATDDFHAVLTGDDFSQIEGFIAKIAPMWLKSSFALSDVQKAFDFYRIVLIPILLDSKDLCSCYGAFNVVPLVPEMHCEKLQEGNFVIDYGKGLRSEI